MRTAMAIPCREIKVSESFDPWFADKTGEAKRMCRRCPIRQQCQDEGWKHPYGVFGGLSPADRRRMDPERYAEAVKAYERESARLDRMILARRAARFEGRAL